MLTFRPITYSDSDLRAFKYTGTTSIREGAFCKLPASVTRHTITCTLASGNAPTLHLVSVTGTVSEHTSTSTVYMPNNGLVFPIFRDDPDIENVGATIDQNDYVIGMLLRPGSEFEVHQSALHRTTLASFAAVGNQVVLGTSGKLFVRGGTNTTGLIVGICTGTFAAKWLRVRAI